MATRSYTKGDEPVPGYRLKSFLGRGGFGEVWKASAPGETETAIKIISLGDKNGLKEFRAIRLVKNIKHPNLVPINAFWLRDESGAILGDASKESDSVWMRTGAELIIAMGLGDMNLSDRLRICRGDSKPGIPVDELLDYMEASARAIDYLNQPTHQLGSGPAAIQHCDIKPQNILIVGGSVQVCDFGLARVLNADVRSTSEAAGSYAYIAPELIDGSRPSKTTDQYSLAISYVELRTGAFPFKSAALYEVMVAKTQGKLNFSALPEAEQTVLKKAAAVNPNDRYPTTMEMVRALRKAVEGTNTSRPLGSSQTARPHDLVREGVEIVPYYKLVRPLGRGGYGEVWEATAPGGKRVALKIISNLAAIEGKQEFKALELIKGVDHNHLMELHAYWLLDAQGQVIPDDIRGQPGAPEANMLVIATKLANMNLLQRLKECRQAPGNQGGIPTGELLGYMRQAAEAIDYLNTPRHFMGDRAVSIQHRDIKPENILLASGTVKVGDFGLAKVLEGSSAVIHGDSTGRTDAYAAPEIFSNKVTAWSDQYSLALTYHYLRTGRLPFRAGSSVEIMLVHVHGKLDLSALPEEERAVMARATALAPEERFASCLAMVEALEQASGLGRAVEPLRNAEPNLAGREQPSSKKPQPAAAAPDDGFDWPAPSKPSRAVPAAAAAKSSSTLSTAKTSRPEPGEAPVYETLAFVDLDDKLCVSLTPDEFNTDTGGPILFETSEHEPPTNRGPSADAQPSPAPAPPSWKTSEEPEQPAPAGGPDWKKGTPKSLKGTAVPKSSRALVPVLAAAAAVLVAGAGTWIYSRIMSPTPTIDKAGSSSGVDGGSSKQSGKASGQSVKADEPAKQIPTERDQVEDKHQMPVPTPSETVVKTPEPSKASPVVEVDPVQELAAGIQQLDANAASAQKHFDKVPALAVFSQAYGNLAAKEGNPVYRQQAMAALHKAVDSLPPERQPLVKPSYHALLARHVESEIPKLSEPADFARVLPYCRELAGAKTGGRILACLAEAQIETGGDWNQAWNAIETSKPSSGDAPYPLYVHALVYDKSETKDDPTLPAAELLKAFARFSATPELQVRHRRQRAARILVDAAQAQRIPYDATRPFQAPYKSAADVENAYNWLTRASEILPAAGSEPALSPSAVAQIRSNLALAAWYKPVHDGKQALSLITDLLPSGATAANLPGTDLFPLLLVKARAEDAEPQSRKDALVTYAQILQSLRQSEKKESGKNQDGPEISAEHVFKELLQPATTLVKDLKLTGADGELARSGAKLHGALGDLVGKHREIVSAGNAAQQEFEAYNDALRLDDSQAGYFVGRAIARAKLGGPDVLARIGEDAREALQRDPKHPGALGLQGYVLQMEARQEKSSDERKTKLKKALAQYQEAIQVCKERGNADEELPPLLMNRSNASASLGYLHSGAERKRYFDMASADLEERSRFKQPSPDSYLALGIAMENLEKYAAAFAQFDRAVKKRNDVARYYLARGRCQFKRVAYGDEDDVYLDRAIADFKTVLGKSPEPGEQVEALYRLGNAYRFKHNYPEANLHFQKALDFLKSRSGQIRTWDELCAQDWARLPLQELEEKLLKNPGAGAVGLFEKVRKRADRLKELADERKWPNEVFEAARLRLRLFELEGKPAEALREYEQVPNKTSPAETRVTLELSLIDCYLNPDLQFQAEQKPRPETLIQVADAAVAQLNDTSLDPANKAHAYWTAGLARVALADAKGNEAGRADRQEAVQKLAEAIKRAPRHHLFYARWRQEYARQLEILMKTEPDVGQRKVYYEEAKRRLEEAIQRAPSKQAAAEYGDLLKELDEQYRRAA